MLPKDILNLIHSFAAYTPAFLLHSAAEWRPVREHVQQDYGWLPMPPIGENLIELPMW